MKDTFLEWKTGKEEITSLTGLFKGKTQSSGADLICINMVHCIYIPCVRVNVHSLSRVLLFATPRTVACQIPLSVEFSKQEYWSRLPFLTPGDLLNSEIEPHLFHLLQS